MSKTHLLLIEPLTTLLLYTSVFQKFNNLMTRKKSDESSCFNQYQRKFKQEIKAVHKVTGSSGKLILFTRANTYYTMTD